MMTRDDNSWIALLPLNRFGLPVLDVEIVRSIAREFPEGWYIAPHAMRWTVGKAALGQGDRRFHVLEASGEPVCFPDPTGAGHYLRTVLKLKSFIDLSDPPKPASPARLPGQGAD